MRHYYTKRIVFAMYKAARDVHTNGIHNTYTSKGRGKMNHIKQFFREKGLYLFCLAMVFAATAAGILALRTVVSNVADLTRTRKEALQNDSAWTQPDTAIDKPAQDVPKPTTTPAATEKPAATPAPAAAQAPKATAAPPAQTVTKPGIWDAKPLAAFSGNELVYSATLGDWRTHNGADYAAPAGESVTAAKAGKVVSVSEDALWGGVVEVEDANGVTWRYEQQFRLFWLRFRNNHHALRPTLARHRSPGSGLCRRCRRAARVDRQRLGLPGQTMEPRVQMAVVCRKRELRRLRHSSVATSRQNGCVRRQLP